MSESTTRPGQLGGPERKFVVPYIEFECDRTTMLLYQGDENVEITPLDRGAWRIRVFATPSDYDTFFHTEADFVDLRSHLPPILKGFNVTFNNSHGDGDAKDIGSAFSFGSTVSKQISLSARANGSEAVMPDVSPIIEESNASNVLVNVYNFYLDTPTAANILAKLTTALSTSVLTWPRFRPVAISITLGGAAVSHAVGASYSLNNQLTESGNGSLAFSVGDSKSDEVSITTTTKDISPTLHSALVITPTFVPPTVNVRAQVGFAGEGGSRGSESEWTKAQALISPRNFPATTPEAYPTSGLYLFRVDTQEAAFDKTLIRAVVVDFSNV